MSEPTNKQEQKDENNIGMDPDGHKHQVVITTWWCSRFWYVPLILVILAGFVCGGHLTFNLYFNSELHSSGLYSNEQARYYLHLFGAEMIGTSLYCTFLFASDANAKMYTG